MTAWEQEWEAKHRRQRWIERDGYFYPRGMPLTLVELDIARRKAEQRAAAFRASRARRASGVVGSTGARALPAPARVECPSVQLDIGTESPALTGAAA